MELPTEIIKSTEINPKTLILFSKPKSGKTTIVSALKDCLLIDFEKGSDYVDAMKIKINNFNDLKELKNALQSKYVENGNHPIYTYGAFDTITALEEIALELALQQYRTLPVGKNLGLDTETGKYNFVDMRTLPNGAGYLYIRQAFLAILKGFTPFFKYKILLGHTKDKMINRMGKELSENTLDLTGKLERIVSSQADGLGFVYRIKNQTIINFNGGEDSIVEARPSHLRGKEIVIAESDKDGKFTFHWDKIYK